MTTPEGTPRLRVLLASAAAGLAVLTGCGGTSARSAPPPTSGTPSVAATTRAAAPSPASVHADELGQVPIVMVHQVVADPKGDYDISPAELRAALETLASGGYVPVTMAALATGRIDVPAGRSPVVLTFDDSTTSQLTLAGGQPTAGCAVGVLQAVAAEHPGFTATATFYVNQHAFGQADPTPYLQWLDRHGYEVGDHTVTHANLRQLDAAGVTREVGGIQEVIRAALGHPATTMALPFGALPRPASLARQGGTGTSAYDFAAVLLVGANPAPSPYSTGWDRTQVPRIRLAHRHVDLDLASWLPKLAATRYVSDGDPSHVSFPTAEAARLAPAFAGQALAY